MAATLTARNAPLMAGRWYKPALFGATALILGLAAAEAVVLVQTAAALHWAPLGVDYQQVMNSVHHWLSTGELYRPDQLSGPFQLADGSGPPMYPPTAFALMIPFAFLPSLVWWIVPALLIGYSLAHHRPSMWTWPLMAFCLAYPRSLEMILYGQPSLMIAGLAAAGTVWGWPAALIVLKPTLAPLALIGVRRRSWWITAAVLALASLLLLPLWIEWLTVVRNATGAGLLYSINDLPLVLVPVVAWLGATWRSRTP